MVFEESWLVSTPPKVTSAVVFRDHGALRITESWEDDVPDGNTTSFPMAVKRQENEILVLSWIEWPSKEVRNAGMQKMFSDPRMQPEQKNCRRL
ncbi:MAG: DUF1428 domain-containing protein [Aliiglaciecola sp.]|uniref:DUF1428 domain-containing protein n=1 Tax=Aliiglaciecola sp. TaxID=1872441 RepID=UPI0032972C80